jgi:hypothetical protein
MAVWMKRFGLSVGARHILPRALEALKVWQEKTSYHAPDD